MFVKVIDNTTTEMLMRKLIYYLPDLNVSWLIEQVQQCLTVVIRRGNDVRKWNGFGWRHSHSNTIYLGLVLSAILLEYLVTMTHDVSIERNNKSLERVCGQRLRQRSGCASDVRQADRNTTPELTNWRAVTCGSGSVIEDPTRKIK